MNITKTFSVEGGGLVEVSGEYTPAVDEVFGQTADDPACDHGTAASFELEEILYVQSESDCRSISIYDAMNAIPGIDFERLVEHMFNLAEKELETQSPYLP